MATPFTATSSHQGSPLRSDRTLGHHNRSSYTASASRLNSVALPTTTATMRTTGCLVMTLRRSS
jgi:hypothetical protein